MSEQRPTRFYTPSQPILNFSVILIALGLFTRGILYIGYDTLVIYFGLSIVTVLVYICCGMILVGTGIFIIKLVPALVRYYATSKPKEQHDTPVLPASGRLDPVVVARQYQNLLASWGPVLEPFGTEIAKSFQQMDTYQAQLETLLKQNDADILNDTIDVLDRAEQQLYRNVRRLINILTVSDTSAPQTAIEQVKHCYQDDRIILASVKDFLQAIAEYLNTQGAESNTDEIAIYKNVLLKQIQTEEENL